MSKFARLHSKSGTRHARDSEARILKDISTPDGTPTTEITEKILNQYGIMLIINYLGDILAGMINKPPNAAKGFILFSIESQLGDDAIYKIKSNQLIDVINGSLKNRLEGTDIPNVDEIVKLLSEKLVDKQAILKMMED